MTRLTPEQLAARQAERAAKDLAQHIALHEALGNLIAMKRLNLKPTNRNLLQAEWDYAKAMHELYSDDCTQAMLDDACANLGVDEEGEELPFEPDRDGYGDYLYECRRDKMLDEQIDREFRA